MADKADNPYARLYGSSAHNFNNSTRKPNQPNSYSPIQPQSQHSPQQPWHSHLQPTSELRLAGNLQHVPPADGSMTHLHAGNSAPPWPSAAPAQRGVPADGSFAHQGYGRPAHPWLAAGPPHQLASLQQPHASQHRSANGQVMHSQPAGSLPRHSSEALSQSKTPPASQVQRDRPRDRAAEEPPSKRHCACTHTTGLCKSSRVDDAATSQSREPHADAAGEQGLNREGGHGKATVLIWDVDETLVLFLSLLDGSFARAFGKQVFLALL